MSLRWKLLVICQWSSGLWPRRRGVRNGEEKAREKKQGTQRPNFALFEAPPSVDRDKERRRRGWGCVGDLKMVSYYFFSSVFVCCLILFRLFLGVRECFFYPIRFQFLCLPFLFVSWSSNLFKQRYVLPTKNISSSIFFVSWRRILVLGN